MLSRPGEIVPKSSTVNLTVRQALRLFLSRVCIRLVCCQLMCHEMFVHVSRRSFIQLFDFTGFAKRRLVIACGGTTRDIRHIMHPG